jgi:hypothetical protein
LLVGPASSVVDAAQGGRRNPKRAEARVVPDEPQVLGTITYDTGVNAGFHPDVPAGSPNLNRTVGNRFNSALGGPLIATGMVTMLTTFPANSGVQSLSIAGPPTPANTALVLDFFTANLMANVFNAVTVTPAVTVGPDFLGIFLGVFGGTQANGNLIGMSDMQVNGQNYHAFQAFYGGLSMQTMIEVVANRNAMLRATGDVLVPVELMDFKIQ